MFYLNKTANGLNLTVYAHNSMGFDINITGLNFTLEDRVNNQKYTKFVTLTNSVKDRDSFNASVLFNINNLDSVTPGTLYSVYFTINFKNNEISSPPEHVTAGIINVRVS